MIKKLIKLFLGTLLSSFAISLVINANVGCFSITTTNFAFANWLNISVGTAGALVELVILLIAMYLKQGLSFAGIVNGVVGSLLIDFWCPLLPSHTLLALAGIILLPLAWVLTESCGWGASNQNLLTLGLINKTGKSLTFIRTIQEVTLVIIGLLGSNKVTLFTILLALFFGKLMSVEYKLVGYNPSEIEHKFLIKGGKRERGGDTVEVLK